MRQSSPYVVEFLTIPVLASAVLFESDRGPLLVSIHLDTLGRMSRNMKPFAPFDAVDYLDDEATIAEYLAAALDDPNPDVFLAAVRDVARARGMTRLAHDAGLGRESLYKALAPGAKPRYETVVRLLHALGVKLNVEVLHAR